MSNKTKSIPVIITSAQMPWEKLKDEVENFGVDGYLAGSFDSESAIVKIKEILKKKKRGKKSDTLST
jgi:response regulator RpfG family c-di-GMP phosphodiesterase